MEIIVLGGLTVVILGFAAIFLARATENKTLAQHELAKAELERAKAERELTQLAIEQNEISAANERALMLSKARDNALAQILSADLQSKNDLLAKIGERGGFNVSFSDGNNITDKGTPRITWKWSPFQNAVIKIYRNKGSIFEDIKTVIKNAQLIHVVQSEPEGSYSDREVRPGNTYNYYAFIETRRTGVRAEAVILDLPAEVKSGRVIDENGNEITAFNTVQPQTYEEPFYDGFCYRRLTVEAHIDERGKRKRNLDLRREDLEMDEEEMELQTLERQVRLRSGNLGPDHIKLLIAEAKRIADRGSAIEEAEKMLDAEEGIDERQREIIMAYIRKNSYR